MSLDPADLLDDDGTVDTDKIRARQNRGVPTGQGVTSEECARWRRRLVDCPNVDPVADAVDYSSNTVSEHVTGECSHDHDEPTLTYKRDYATPGGGIWVIADE